MWGWLTSVEVLQKFGLDRIMGKVKVVFNGELNFSSQYRMKDKIQLFPDSVFVFGSKEKLSEIHFVESENTVFENIEKATLVCNDIKKIN